MRSERKKQVMTLSILVAAVLVISVGFAAFSSTLKINTAANINPNATDFKVVFSKSSNSIDESDVTPTLTPDTITASNGTIDNTTMPTLSNLSVDFTSPGQKAVYNLYVYNAGEYEAFLNSVMLQGNKSCTPGEGATVSLVGKACEDIIVSIKIGNDTYSETTTGITGKSIQKGQSTPIEITIEYLSGGDRADGPFSVEFNDISLYYATVNGINEEYEGESGTLYKGTIYSNSTEILYVGDNIDSTQRWCLVAPGLGNSCSPDFVESVAMYSSKTECETNSKALLEQITNSGWYGDEELAIWETATCELMPLSYETDLSNISQSVYLKHDVVNSIVTASYACMTYVENGVRKDACLRGGDLSHFESNKETMDILESYFNTLPRDSGNGYCNNYSYCECFSDSFEAYVGSDGSVRTSLIESWDCFVEPDGSSYCSDWSLWG